ncbi:MAG: MerR family transcriptional regulator [Calditrichia bacterium]
MRIQTPRRKLVYPLRDVCKMTGLSDNVIKRWEQQFPQLKPVRNRAANRYYLERDVKLLFYIRDLIYVHKMDEDEVREKIKKYNPQEDVESPVFLKSILAEIRMELKDIENLLNES